MIVFKDIRLYEKSGIDPDIRKKYPFTIFEAKMKRKKCEGCENLFANVACVGDKLKNGQTSYLCKECH
jgi:RNase P subunit RPR2